MAEISEKTKQRGEKRNRGKSFDDGLNSSDGLIDNLLIIELKIHAYPLMSGVRRLVWIHQDPKRPTAERVNPAVPPFP